MLRWESRGSLRTQAAVGTVVHILNKSPTTVVIGMTPFKAFCGSKLDVSCFGVFGCDAFAHIPKSERGKMDAKSK